MSKFIFAVFMLHTEDEGNIVPILKAVTDNITKAKEIIQDIISNHKDQIQPADIVLINPRNQYTHIGKFADLNTQDHIAKFRSCNGFIIEEMEINKLWDGYH